MIPAFLLSLLLNRYTIGAVLCAGLIIGAYAKGYSNASAKCHDAALRAQIAGLERDMAAWKVADEVEQDQMAHLEKHHEELEAMVSEYEKELAARPPSNNCALSSDDVKRLRGIGKH